MLQFCWCSAHTVLTLTCPTCHTLLTVLCLPYAAHSGDEEQQKVADFKAAFKQAPKGKKGGKKTAAAATAGGKLDGVGTGALAAAKAAVGVDVEKLVTWKKGSPVPYAFLADTFQVCSVVMMRVSCSAVTTQQAVSGVRRQTARQFCRL